MECVSFSDPGNPGIGNPTGPGGGGSGNPSGGNNPSPNPSLTSPVGPKEGAVAVSTPPCISINKNTNDNTSYKQRFKALNTTANYNLPEESGFAQVDNSYVNGTADPISHSILFPHNAKNGTHVHNKIPKTYISTGEPYDASVKMLSVGDLRSMIRNMQPKNTDVKDTFVVMASNEGIFAITILEPIAWSQDLHKKLEEFDTYYNKNVGPFIDNLNSYSVDSRRKFLEKMFLKGLKEAGLENKIALFEGTVENENDPDINNYKIKWTRKTLKKVFLGYDINPIPCN